MRKINVFFYGLFMDEALLQARGIAMPNLRIASVPGFQLRVGNRAALVPSPFGHVFGRLALLSHNEVEQLYSDPSVQSYRPEPVFAYLANGEILPALCFNLPEPPALDEHNPGYAAQLRALAERLQLPPDYVSSIQ